MSSSQTSSSSSDPVPEVEPPHPFAGMLDVVCSVEVLIGTTTITVRDCLRLQRHSVVRLPCPAGADLDVRVHGIRIASGEVVIVDETTGLRISAVALPVGSEAQK